MYSDVESTQAPCLSLVQFQIDDGELVLSAYQRNSDAYLGLSADIYRLVSDGTPDRLAIEIHLSQSWECAYL